MVLPVRGGATIKPRCPLPTGVSRSMTRALIFSRTVSSLIRSCGYKGVRLSNRILLRASSGDSKQNMLAFYRFVADRTSMPVVIYNFPQATGYDIHAEVVVELAEHPNLIGIKESSGSIEKVQKMAEATRASCRE